MSTAVAAPYNQLVTATYRRLGEARRIVQEKAPYIMTSVRALRPVVVDDPQLTMAVTASWMLLVGPQFVEQVSIQVLAFALAHESFHLINRHHQRLERIAAPPHLKNIAADLAINAMLVRAGFEVWSEAVLPSHYGLPDDWTAERYLEALLQQSNQAPPPPPAGGAAKQPGPPGPSGQPSPGQQPTNGQSGPPGPTMGSTCGSGSGGAAHPAEHSQAARQATEEHGVSSIEARQIINQTGQQIRAAIKRGDVSMNEQELPPEEVESSTIPWQTHLERVLLNCTGAIEFGIGRRSYMRPHKASLAVGMWRPIWVIQQPRFGFIEDTSLSMSKQETICVRAQFCKILEDFGVDNACYLQADAKVTLHPQWLPVQDIRQLPVTGRGGTDFRKPIAAMVEQDVDIIVYGTDCDGHYGEEPRVPVVWAQTCPYTVPWGIPVECWDK